MFTASPPPDGGRLLLHFGAVDWEAVVHVNGTVGGEHRGGYDPFTFDITRAVKEGANELVVARPGRLSGQPRSMPTRCRPGRGSRRP